MLRYFARTDHHAFRFPKPVSLISYHHFKFTFVFKKVLIIDFTVVQIQDKFQIEFRHSSFYGVPDLKNVNSIDLEKRVLTKSVYFNCGTL